MNIALWIIQALVALVFLLAGFGKVSQPIEKLQKNMGYIEDYPAWFIRLVGALEILGTVGLILPAATRIATWLTPAAGIGLVLIMIGALLVHVRRKEISGHLAIPVVLLLLALFIVIGRFALAPIA